MPPMPHPEDLTLAPAYVHARLTGPTEVPALAARLLELIHWLKAEKHTRLILDLRGMPEGFVLDTFQRFEIVSSGAEAAAGAMTIAVVCRPELLDQNRFGMQVARNRGLTTQVFTDELNALTWLVGPNAIRPVLETERLALRWLVPTDAPFIYQLTTQPTWLQNIGDRGVRDLATAGDYIINGPRASYSTRGYGLWCVSRKEDGVPVGICGIIKRDSMEAPELAYAILEAFHGQGYGSEAALASRVHARDILGLRRLLAIVDPANAASIRILEKAGMTYQRPITMPGEEKAISLYST